MTTKIPPLNQNRELKHTETNDFFGNIFEDLFELVFPLYDWAIIGLTASFIIGTLVMILSALFKNGQWQKFGQGSLLWSFITLLLLRGLPILIFSINTVDDIGQLLNEFILTLSYSAVFLGVIGLAGSMIFNFGNKLIQHPEFYRRSRTMLIVSFIMVTLSLAVPNLFPQI